MTGTAWLDHDWGDSSTSTYVSIPPKKRDDFKPIPDRYGADEWEKAQLGSGTDVLLRAGTQDFAAHKIVLMAHCSFFRSMFTASLSSHKIVQITDMDPAIFSCLLKFMYTGSLSKETQISYTDNFSKLAEFLSKGESLKLDGIGIWASEFLERAFTCEKKVPDHLYTTLFVLALRMRCDELLEVLLHHICCAHALAHAVGEASLIDGLITKEIWEKIKQNGGHLIRDEVSQIEHCNPLIRTLKG